MQVQEKEAYKQENQNLSLIFIDPQGEIESVAVIPNSNKNRNEKGMS